jgi:hypothetical protein
MNPDTESTYNVAEPQPEPAVGWVKAMRSTEAQDVIRHNPMAYVLAAVIALRARWRREPSPITGLQPGEAMLGDHEEIGMSRQEYRTALHQLEKWGFATIKTTRSGTIAKLTSRALFAVELPAPHQAANHQPTIKQPSSNHQPTTNEERREREDFKNDRSRPDSLLREESGIGGQAMVRGTVTLQLLDHAHHVTRAEELERMCFEVLGKCEMAHCGSRWRARAKNEPLKLERVLADVRAQRKEGKVIRNPGAYAEDLWRKRFG